MDRKKIVELADEIIEQAISANQPTPERNAIVLAATKIKEEANKTPPTTGGFIV